MDWLQFWIQFGVTYLVFGVMFILTCLAVTSHLDPTPRTAKFWITMFPATVVLWFAVFIGMMVVWAQGDE